MSSVITCERDRVRFPAHCMRCRLPASGGYFVDAVQVPLCIACTSKVTITRGLWVALGAALGLAITVGTGAFLDAVLRYPDASGARAMIGFSLALLLLGLGLLVAFLTARFGWRRHAVRWLPVRAHEQQQAEGIVALVFRDAEAAHEVAALSGLADPTGGYRHAPPQAARIAPKDSIFVGLVPLLLMVVSMFAGLRWVGAEADISRHGLEVLLYAVFGTWGPASFWFFATLLFGSFFVAWAWQRIAPAKNAN